MYLFKFKLQIKATGIYEYILISSPLCNALFWQRAIRILSERRNATLPAAYCPHVHVDEIGIPIVANPAALQSQSGIAHFGGGNSRQPNVNGFSQHVETMDGDARIRAAGTQKFVALWSAVSTDDIDLAAVIVNRRCQVVEQVEQMGIEMVYDLPCGCRAGSGRVWPKIPASRSRPADKRYRAARCYGCDRTEGGIRAGEKSRILMFAPAGRQAIRQWATKWCCGFPMSFTLSVTPIVGWASARSE